VQAGNYKDYIGYSLLQSELGGATPDGSGVRVVQAEASVRNAAGDWAWMPNVADVQFSGKVINNMSSAPPDTYSSHATSVGRLFYGSNSIAPGIGTIDSYSASSWMRSDFLNAGNTNQPLSSPARVANHSWISGSAIDYYAGILRRLDWVVETDEFIQVVGMSNSVSNNPPPLLGSAFNVMAVGRTDGAAGQNTANMDDIYTAGRAAPHVVAPLNYTSSSTPVVAAATALLVETGHNNPGLSTDPITTSTVNRSNETIYNAERSEVIKAALMAGADRHTTNDAGANITDYRQDPANRTTNGLDFRYGAGQLNVFNSYHIIAAGEQNSLEDNPAGGGDIEWNGFDYDPSFGGLNGSNSEASYFLTADDTHLSLQASLVWNVYIDGGTEAAFDDTAILYDLDLLLFEYDSVDKNWELLSSSESTIDNTENLWVLLESGASYMLKIELGEGQDDFLWDYALAWKVANPVPVPGAIWLFGSALIGLLSARKKLGQRAMVSNI
jgi:hypothetical protein